MGRGAEPERWAGARAPNSPPPLGLGGGEGVRTLGLGGAPSLRGPRACAFCQSFDSALLIQRVLIGALLRWSRLIFLQSRNQVLFLLVGSSGCADTVIKLVGAVRLRYARGLGSLWINKALP